MTRLTRIVIAASLALWALSAAGLPAQDAVAAADGEPANSTPPAPGGDGSGDAPALSEADIFQSGAFDQAIEQSKQEERKNKLEYLFGGVFLSRAFLATTAAFDGYTATGSFAGKAFVRVSIPSYGSLYLGYNLSHTLFQGEDGSMAFPLPGADLFATTFTLSEFYMSFDLAKALFFRVGNQLLAWGPSVVWTPVDFVNRQRVDPEATVDLRVGKPGLRVHLPLNSANLFLFTDFADTVVENPSPPPDYLIGNLFEKTNFGIRGDLTALGFEFGLTAYLGAAIRNHYGFDLSGRLLGLDLYGELAMAFPHGSYAFSYMVAAGFQRTFGELQNWTLQGEFFYNSVGQEDNAAYSNPTAFVDGGYVPFYVGRMYAYVGITKQDLIGTFLDGTLSGYMNISDLSGSVSLRGAFDIPGFFPFSITLAYSGGGEGKEFTVFTGDNALSLTAQVSFEF